MAEGFEPSTQHRGVDIYKLERSPSMEEHMFLLFAQTPPHDVQAPLPLKPPLFTSHAGIVLTHSLSLSLRLPFSHTQSAAGHFQ